MEKSEFCPAFAANNIPIALACSNCYAPYAGVLLRSLMDTAGSGWNYDVVILEREISGENKRILTGMTAGRANISVRFYNPGDFLAQVDVAGLGTEQFPLELYFRVLAPHMLRCYERLITIDVDMLVKRDLAELFQTDLGGACVGAVPDIFWQGFYQTDYVFASNKMSARTYFKEILNMKDPMNYVSGGLVLYDCVKYRQALDWKSIISTAQAKRYMWLDQCELNALLEGKITFLDSAWNIELAANPRSQYAVDAAPEETRRAYDRALASPAVLHWAGKPKPWVCPDVPYGSEWWRAAMQTPFVGHILARMFDELQTRREYYRGKYGQEVAVWEPAPQVNRSLGESGERK